MAKVALDPFRARAFRIAVAQVVSMAVHPPRTRAGTDRPKSSELILTHLDGAQNPHSLDRIKPRCFVLHDATAPPLLANAPLPRSQISSQPYNKSHATGPRDTLDRHHFHRARAAILPGAADSMNQIQT